MPSSLFALTSVHRLKSSAVAKDVENNASAREGTADIISSNAKVNVFFIEKRSGFCCETTMPKNADGPEPITSDRLSMSTSYYANV